ncbi:MAG: NADP-dependent isocitrate dehydrogenase [Phenylobacterium sp.]|nr:NADP-dependent isocitrate dehydrogenase [Phenylobacterium sp.]MBP9756499.1 NADP-dependent isocitrate dehydrogenase [Phenylobacterium sp.]
MALNLKSPITVAHGDGIGPEIMAASLRILEAAGAQLDIETVEIGEAVYRRGRSSGIEPATWDSLRRTKVFYKAPITTPQGGGFKSLNVTVRKTLGLYANVRPCVAYAPFVATRHPKLDLVIIRENEEDLYAGIEHRQTDEVFQCLKLITRPGSERIIRYAFEYARSHGRRKVTCLTKDNIMKMTDGLFRKVFDEIGEAYPDIEKSHAIIDIGAARLADTPEDFDVIVTLNLYGDIISDIAAQLAGSVGLAGSANIGEEVSMFEAIHGSAPDLAGQDRANPSGALLAGVMMLSHLGQTQVAERVHNAWLTTLEDGVHTEDIYQPGVSKTQVGTRAFADAVIARLGQEPKALKATRYAGNAPMTLTPLPRRPPAVKATVGVDLFVQWRGGAQDLARRLEAISADPLSLTMITNRGVKVWPDGLPETFCTDHWRCRFMNDGGTVSLADIVALSHRAAEGGVDFIKTEHLCTFDGEPGFSLGQGQ